VWLPKKSLGTPSETDSKPFTQTGQIPSIYYEFYQKIKVLKIL
jgi:hypothetical protein